MRPKVLTQDVKQKWDKKILTPVASQENTYNTYKYFRNLHNCLVLWLSL